MIEFIKKNWLIAVISGATGSIITTIFIKHWFSKDMSDIITNWITALSSLAVAVFAWMAYKEYWKQKKKEQLFTFLIEASNLFTNDAVRIYLKITSYLKKQYVNFNSGNISIKFTKEYGNSLIAEADIMREEIHKFINLTIPEWRGKLLFLDSLSTCVLGEENKIHIHTEEKINQMRDELKRINWHILKIKAKYLKGINSLAKLNEPSSGFKGKLTKWDLDKLKEPVFGLEELLHYYLKNKF
ncbi:hypothetical protein [Aquella oligotrophica]|uniref:Uncharacterized protein n=1 Tax=Aquella oligotrophica TaxID=2067065 RepID=A0A2I7N3A5_9NEIS|nr:hypothetical protein [Aquella oligotrophica]AUR50930.1 hypothetical protein CUN60_00965 [Aquella oligotrophica]